jgi:hypothetical protein
MSAREVAPIVIFATMLPLCFRALVLRDRLLKGLYLRHRVLWRQLGRPSGWMWRAPEGTLFPEMKISFGMLRSQTPAWLEDTPDLQDTYFACRRIARLWNFVAMPVWIVTIVVFVFAAF